MGVPVAVPSERRRRPILGTFELKLNDPQGNGTTSPGKYVVVWKKQPTHNWKAVADIFNTDK